MLMLSSKIQFSLNYSELFIACTIFQKPAPMPLSFFFLLCIPSSGNAYSHLQLTLNFEDSEIVSVCPYPEICLTEVIDTSMERSSSTTPWKPQNLNFFKQKSRNWIFICILTCDDELESPNLRQYQFCIGNWYMIGEVFTSTSYTMETQKNNFLF